MATASAVVTGIPIPVRGMPSSFDCEPPSWCLLHHQHQHHSHHEEQQQWLQRASGILEESKESVVEQEEEPEPPAIVLSVPKQERNITNSNNLQSTLKTLTPFQAPIKSSLKSSLKSSSRFNTKSNINGRPCTERRVGGLWNATDNNQKINHCYWSKLRDETMVGILEFLNLADILTVGMVSKRFRSIVRCSDNNTNDNTLWHSVDATEFVQIAHKHFSRTTTSRTPSSSAQQRTGMALEELLKRHNPVRLVIRDIQDRLSADSFLPNVASLKDLTLTHFQDLTDTHVHVLLLLLMKTQQQQKSHSLRNLALHHCPLLTTASLRSIVSQCHSSLESLSLGGCPGISSLEPLAPLLPIVVVRVDGMPTATATKTNTNTNKTVLQQQQEPLALSVSPAASHPVTEPVGLLSMFGPPTLTTPVATASSTNRDDDASILSNGFASTAQTFRTVSPTSTASTTSTSSLQSLFAPPAPPLMDMDIHAPSVPSNSNAGIGGTASCSSSNNAHLAMGKLQALDLQGFHPMAVLKLFQAGGTSTTSSSTTTTRQISLRSLKLDGQHWTDHQLDQLGPMIAWSHLTELSFLVQGCCCCCCCCCSSEGQCCHSSSLSEKSLVQWASRAQFSPRDAPLTLTTTTTARLSRIASLDSA